MRYFAVIAGLLFASVSLPATAATIVQYDSESGAFSGFAPFDPTLGTLNSVTLEVSLWRPRAWMLDAESEEPTTATVDWSIDGQWLLPGSDATGGVELAVALIGAGSSSVIMDLLAEGRAFGFFRVEGSGGASFLLNPAAFLGSQIFFNGYDPGYLGLANDTSFTAGEQYQLTHLAGACPGFDGPYPEAEDLCGSTSYTLTYDYTPAVPEPGTWAMMLLGFAGTGLALRRSRRRTTQVAA